MKKRIVFATGNAGKMKEIKMILGDLGMPVVSMKEAGIEADIVEDGTSFAENAQIRISFSMHLEAYVASLIFFPVLKVLIALISPIVPMDIRSSTPTPVLSNFFAM